MTSRPLRRGDRVNVPRLRIPFRPFFETRSGLLIAATPDIANLWTVGLPGDAEPQLRFVHPGVWQTNADEILAGLLDHFRATVDPSVLAELFPFNRGKGDR